VSIKNFLKVLKLFFDSSSPSQGRADQFAIFDAPSKL